MHWVNTNDIYKVFKYSREVCCSKDSDVSCFQRGTKRLEFPSSKASYTWVLWAAHFPSLYLLAGLLQGNIPQAEEGKLSATIVGKKNLRY